MIFCDISGAVRVGVINDRENVTSVLSADKTWSTYNEQILSAILCDNKGV